MPGKLYLGTRTYSSWSLRGWLLVRLAGLDVEEIIIPLAGTGTPDVKAVSPNFLVPYLEHDGAKIWESLAIAEYCAEFQPSLWPSNKIARAHARSIAAEMHAGFGALRRAMPMNLARPDYAGLGHTPEALADIAHIDQIFTNTLATSGGPYLFGETFTAADAMYAPVIARFLTYAPPLSAPSQTYCHAVRAHNLVSLWYDLAAQEPQSWRLEKYESLK